MFFLVQGDEVTCFNDVKQRVPEAYHESIKTSCMSEKEFISLMGDFMDEAPTDANLSPVITDMKDELSKYLTKHGWENLASIVHYEPDNPNYLP